MCKRIVVLLLGTLLPVMCLAQDGGWLRSRGNTRIIQLGEDVYLLQRLVSVQLTDPQLASVLEAYKQNPEQMDTTQKEAVEKLQAMRQRLLSGTPLVATDLATIRDLWREASRGPRGGRGDRPGQGQGQQPATTPEEPLSALELAIWGLLDTTQKAALLGEVRQAAANNQKFDQLAGERAMKQIAKLREMDDTAFAAARDKLAEALCAGAGAVGSPQRDNSRKMFVDFLTRVRQMSAADFASKQKELAAELMALLPPETSITVALAEFETRVLRTALSNSFLHPRAPELLLEIQAERAKAGQQ